MRRARAITLVELLVATALAAILIGILAVVFVKSQEIAGRVTDRIARAQHMRLFEDRLAEDLGALDVTSNPPALARPTISLAGKPAMPIDGRRDRLTLVALRRPPGQDIGRITAIDYGFVEGHGVVRTATPYQSDNATPDVAQKIVEELVPEATAFRLRWTRPFSPSGAVAASRFQEPEATTENGSAFTATSDATLALATPRTFALALAQPIPGIDRGSWIDLKAADGTALGGFRIAGFDATARPLVESALLAPGACKVSVPQPPSEIEATLVLPEHLQSKLSIVRVVRVARP